MKTINMQTADTYVVMVFPHAYNNSYIVILCLWVFLWELPEIISYILPRSWRMTQSAVSAKNYWLEFNSMVQIQWMRNVNGHEAVMTFIVVHIKKTKANLISIMNYELQGLTSQHFYNSSPKISDNSSNFYWTIWLIFGKFTWNQWLEGINKQN